MFETQDLPSKSKSKHFHWNLSKLAALELTPRPLAHMAAHESYKSSFLLLVAMPGAPSSVFAPSSK